MAFWLYTKTDKHFTRKEIVKFTGANGLFARFLQEHKNADAPFRWELKSADIIRLINPSLNPARHEILIDMLPEAFVEVSLYRITSIQGVSQYDESDIVMACKLLHQGSSSEPAGSFKKAFRIQQHESERQMVEAFRLTGGVGQGTYLWGKPKMDIGAAICPGSKKAGIKDSHTPAEALSA
ncbi:hypothetical protein [Coraliomargarita parva]|uniref:hypothetical protein n=1 Tax=Coraliomargarita parva TaxID=3014050 RepID=UPI0022B57AFA|nr:hypothetical protein [Coraliomargarita parva]